MVALTVAVVLPLAGVPAAAQTQERARSEAAPVQSKALDEAAAVAVAKRSGRRVEVASARTESSQVFATPSGGLVLEAGVAPQRVRRMDGSWADVDSALRKGADGRWRPGASVANVSFSNGGTGPFATLVHDTKTFDLSWRGRLPTPTVTTDSATYADVLPGVDLIVRATRTGFTPVVVVRTPQAAANPRVRLMRFAVGGDAHIVRLPGGELSAVADGVLLASAPPASMWDSSSLSSKGRKGSEAEKSSTAGPGDAAVTAPVASEVTSAGDLLLRPAATLLNTAVFPLFVDPAWSTGKSRWAYATNNNSNNTDTSVARVGKDPDSGVVYRSYFDFPLSAVRGKHIQSAYVQMKLRHSWSCTDTITHLYHSNGIQSTPRTAWAPKLTEWIGQAYSHANKGSGCADSPQPDMVVNFQSGHITNLIQSHATANLTNVTLGFCACGDTAGVNETAQDRYKKFYPNDAKLIVDYSSYPGPPNSLQVAGVACTAGQRIGIGTLTPTLSAIFPDADSGQALRTSFEWLQIPDSGTYDDSTPRLPAPPTTSVPAGGRSQTAVLSLPTGGETKSYAFRTRATDPAPYNLTSSWSPWCEFTPDTTVPPVTVSVVTPAAGPGEPCTFRIESTATDVSKFRYGWTAPSTEVAATGTGPKSATVTLTVPKYGKNILHVSAIDAAGNQGSGSTGDDFIVGRPSPSVARWGLEIYPGVTEAQAAADRQPALGDTDGDGPLRADTPLTLSGTGWGDGVRLVGGRTATFGAGYATTAGPVVNTAKSFSVAAWVRLSALPTQNMTIASQDGACVFGYTFGVGLVGAVPHWQVGLRSSDCDANPTWPTMNSAAAITSADVGRWQHVAFSYDETTRSFTLFLNGHQVGSMAFPSWRAAGPLEIGRYLFWDAHGGSFNGAIADVQVFDRVLVGNDFTGQLATDPLSGGVDEPGILAPTDAGEWNMNAGVPCYVQDLEDTCESPDATGVSRWLALSKGTDIGVGHRDNGLLLDGYYFPGENPEPWETTSEYARSATKAGVDTSGSQPLTLWHNTPVLRTDQSYTVSAWVRPDRTTGTDMTAVAQQGQVQSAFELGARSFTADGVTKLRWAFTAASADSAGAGSVTASMTSQPLSDDATGEWTHLVAVYDAADHQIRLYVNGELKATTAQPSAWNATEPLTVGAARWSPPGGPSGLGRSWQGGIDDVTVYQGALTDAGVKHLFDDQSVT
jgi:Concanavalin A-like lectin/glucanases superfamily